MRTIFKAFDQIERSYKSDYSSPIYPFYLHACATWSELPSNTSTPGCTGVTRGERETAGGRQEDIQHFHFVRGKTMVLLKDGSTEYVAHVQTKMGLSALDIIKCLKQIK